MRITKDVEEIGREFRSTVRWSVAVFGLVIAAIALVGL